MAETTAVSGAGANGAPALVPPPMDESAVAADGGGAAGTATAPLRVNDETFMRSTVQKTVKEVIGAEEYAHARTDGWTNDIVDNLVKNLVALDRSYKYIVTCMIVQKCGAGMRSSTQCFWNPASDIGLSVQVENPSMYVITTVFACKA
ncbi:hypothetical protein BU14_0014s0123 [Porphyra umbilicalis]|uniref:Dynein light chain Tctex-type 1 n=1 Tax=Porphyra umbilicalis TaxID=2786 RepID=A0A1X6PLC9_PORUM|nr:hypothetical protein BU14_0014s0123 [Porphyra umbilicalis]|eukprot:OSX81576.1 hypothetical protein BU14_0014s0123 [Porphyra umbilicalis]